MLWSNKIKHVKQTKPNTKKAGEYPASFLPATNQTEAFQAEKFAFGEIGSFSPFIV
jgi:hypothetical protein